MRDMKRIAKSDLPQKPCVHCGRPMVWRKAWAKNWDDVKYCSDRCAGEAKRVRVSQKSTRPQP
jgi:hypothetical protein